MQKAIEAFEREFAPWALKLPAGDVAARRKGQLRANGWSVLYEFGEDAYGEYLDYYAALRGATDARVHDDWHARIYATGQIVAFPAVLEAYLYGRDPSQEELDRAREPVLASLAPPTPDAEESAGAIGTADTALWEDLREVVEAEVAGVSHPAPEPQKTELPRRPSAETPAEIDSVLDAAFGDNGAKPKPVEQVERPIGEQAPIERDAAASAPMSTAPSATVQPKKVAPKPAPVVPPAPVVEKEEEPAAPRRSVPGYDPFVELRTLEPKSSRRAAPTGDDFRPYWQRYPGRSAGIAAAVAAVLVIAIMMMSHGGKKTGRIATADTTSVPSTAPAADTASASQADTQTVGSPQDTPDTASATAPAPATVAAPAGNESSVARPVGPGSIAPIVRTDGSAASPATSHRFARPSGS